MGRQLRPRLPGVPFHITARAQGREPLFAGVEGRVAELIRGSIQYSDAELLAFAVMPNHIHVIVVQGRRPLGEFMQPLLRRIALAVMGRTGHEGHVFGGRYSHRACQDPDYFRSMVAYVHLNPVRAGLCRAAGDYEWSSHRDYARPPRAVESARYALTVEQGVRVFARESDQTIGRCRRDYLSFIRWRQSMDFYLSDDGDGCQPVSRAPLSLGGDLHWYREYGSARVTRVAGTDGPTRQCMDLRDHVRVSLTDLDPAFPFELLRSGGSTRPLVRVRRRVIARALAAGYPGSRVADFLNISPTTVSRVKAGMREGSTL